MKKYLTIFSALLLGAFVIVSCGDDDPEEPNQPEQPVDNPDQPTQQETFNHITKAYVVCSGNMYSNIDGALSFYSFSENSYGHAQDTFKKANGRSLGATPNDGLAYGSKVYIVVDGENTIEVINATSHKSIKQIKTTELLGEEEGHNPRHIVAKDGKIYVDTYGGYVAAIDTTNYTLTARYQVGSYPEGMAFDGNILYVANSDYGMGTNPSISAINLATNEITTHKSEEINNPTTLAFVNGALFIVDGDVYDPTTWAITKPGGLRMMKDGGAGTLRMGETAMGANQIAAKGDSLFIVSDAYSDDSKLLILNTKDLSISELPLKDFGNVNVIGVDPVTELLFAGCYTKQEGADYADYSAPGICNVYTLKGEKVTDKCFKTGVGPTAIFFNHTVEKVNK